MITLLKWIGAAGAGALFAVIVLFYTAQNQQKTEVKIDMETTKTDLAINQMLNDPFFTPNKEDREALKKENERLRAEIEAKRHDIAKRQQTSDEFVKDAQTALKELDKELAENNKKLTKSK